MLMIIYDILYHLEQARLLTLAHRTRALCKELEPSNTKHEGTDP